MRPLKIIISGGGTGGHIFPAIAIANALKNKRNDAEILFVGAKGRMEMEKVPQAGYKIEGLWISGLQRSLSLKNLSFPFKLISSLMKARKIVKQFKPDVVVGVGGYASGPLLRVATGMGVPALIQEQNSYPGITNKLLAKRVQRICVAYNGMERFFPAEKIVETGNPVRQNVVDIEGKKEEAIQHFGLDLNKRTLLVVGGSLGARSVNQAIALHLQQLVDEDIQLIWQTGSTTYKESLSTAQPFLAKGVQVHAFINEMDYAYAAADLVVSRAGAIAVSELCLTGKPCILVPLPHAAEDHQTKNAMALVERNAAVLVVDRQADQKLTKTIIELIRDENKRSELSKNIFGLGKKNAADQITDEVLKLVK